MSFKKVNTKSDTWNFDEMAELEGEYVDVKDGVGANKSNLYYVKREDGKEIAFWGTALLDDQMRLVPIGSRIRIKYLGMERSQKGNREYRNFETEVWEED